MSSSPPPLRPRLTIPTSPEQSRNQGSLKVHARSNEIAQSANNPASAFLISPAAMPLPIVHTFLDSKTGSETYIVADPVTEEAVVINPVLDFETPSNRISTKSADSVLEIVENEGYSVTYLLETSMHRQHISACRYIQDKLSRASGLTPRLCIGRNVHGTAGDTNHEGNSTEQIPVENSYFDKLFVDAEKFRIGNIVGEAIYLSTNAGTFPTPTEMVAYLIGPNIFTNVPNGIESLSESSRQRLSERSTDHHLYGLPLNLPERTAAPVTIGKLREHMTVATLHNTARTLSPTEDSPSTMQFYATKINALGGRIPKKVNIIFPDGLEDGKQKALTPRPLLIPKKLEMLLC